MPALAALDPPFQALLAGLGTLLLTAAGAALVIVGRLGRGALFASRARDRRRRGPGPTSLAAAVPGTVPLPGAPSFGAAVALAVGIALQNVPEGASG